MRGTQTINSLNNEIQLLKQKVQNKEREKQENYKKIEELEQ